jgi:hypothetical protein
MSYASALLLTVALVALVLAGAGGAAAEAKGRVTTIRPIGGTVELTVPVEDGFGLTDPYALCCQGSLATDPRFWALPLSPRPLPVPPSSPGPGYIVFDEYWDLLADQHELPGTDPVALTFSTATYFPEVGAVRLGSQGRGWSWFRLDSGRDAFLRRYAALASQGVGGRPSFFDVAIASRNRGEPFGISFWDRARDQHLPLEGDQVLRFWVALARSTSRPDLQPADFGADANGFHSWSGGIWPLEVAQDVWITFTLPEGRAINYVLMRPEGTLTLAVEDWASWPAYNTPVELMELAREVVGPVDRLIRVPPVETANRPGQVEVLRPTSSPSSTVAVASTPGAAGTPTASLAEPGGLGTPWRLAMLAALLVAVWIARETVPQPASTSASPSRRLGDEPEARP